MPYDEYRLELRQDIVNGILYEINDNFKFNFIAFNNEDIFNNGFTVNNQAVTKNINNVFYKSVDISYSDFINGEIPFGVIEPEIEDNGNASINNSYNGVNYFPYIEVYDYSSPVVIKFKIPKDINDITEYEINYDDTGCNTQIYNCSSNSWEDVNIYNSYIKEKDIIKNYINENNEISLMLLNIDESYDIEPPKIRLKIN